MAEKYDKRSVEAEISAFINASEYKGRAERKGMVSRLQEQVGILIAECPECQTVQKITTYFTRKCIKCGSTFQIFPENDFARLHNCKFNDAKLKGILMIGRALKGRNTFGL